MATLEKPTRSGWVADTLLDLARLFELEPNWNSYGAHPIAPVAVGNAMAFMVKAMAADTTRPSVIASPRGGVQFEWHRNGIDLEIEATADGTFGVLFMDEGKGCEEEKENLSLDAAIAWAVPYISAYAR